MLLETRVILLFACHIKTLQPSFDGNFLRAIVYQKMYENMIDIKLCNEFLRIT